MSYQAKEDQAAGTPKFYVYWVNSNINNQDNQSLLAQMRDHGYES